MSIIIRTATEADVLAIASMVNEFAAQDIMLPRTEAGIRQTLEDWLLAVDDSPTAWVGDDAGEPLSSHVSDDNSDDNSDSNSDEVSDDFSDVSSAAPSERLVGCGSLVPLTETLVEIRSLATHSEYQGQGIGGRLVNQLVSLAKERGFAQVCALTLRADFFTRLGFAEVDRWSISPKVWQACIYCRKFHHCDEVAVLMNLVNHPTSVATEKIEAKIEARNRLMRWSEWQPLRLAYQQTRTQESSPQENLSQENLKE